MSTIDPAVFRKAARIIHDGGLMKGAFVHKGAHCTLGAVIAVTGEPTVVKAADFLVTLIPNAGPCTCGACHIRALQPAMHTVTAWNDKRERTEGDVIELLERAAEMAQLDQDADIAMLEEEDVCAAKVEVEA